MSRNNNREMPPKFSLPKVSAERDERNKRAQQALDERLKANEQLKANGLVMRNAFDHMKNRRSTPD